MKKGFIGHKTLRSGGILAALMALLLGCGEVPIPEPDEAFDHFVGDFETGSLAGFHFLVLDTAINTPIVRSPVRKGAFALQNTLRPDDYIYNGYRAELAVYNCAKYKTDVYYGFSFMIDTNYSDQAFNLICQWQDLPDYVQGEAWEPDPNLRGSSPPLALVYVDGQIELKMNRNPRSNGATFLVGSPQTVLQGQWIDVVAHMYWSDDAAAFTEVWLDGAPITPFNGVDHKYYQENLFNRAGNYFKFGQYRGKDATAHTNTIYFDEVKVGSTYQEVAP